MSQSASRRVRDEPSSSQMPRDVDIGSQSGTSPPRGRNAQSGRRGSKQPDTNASPSTALEADFDIYAFLNEGRTEVSRDPILQQMTVIKYEGDLDQATGFFHGHGRLISTLGYTYTGNFDRGLMHGQGRIEWSDGVMYEGTFSSNVIDGNGKYTWPNGDWYQGEVSSCVRNGKGTFHYKALNATYEGGWDHGRRQGTGVLTYAGTNVDGTSNNSMYSGDWHQDKRQGQGVMQYPDGSIYEGTWIEDIREGTGCMKWRRNNVVVEEYTGQWVAGIPSGFGQSTYIRPPPIKAAATGHTPKVATLNTHLLSATSLDGAAPRKDSAINSYLGEFSAGQRHGFGTFVYDDGSKYEGQWVDNQKHGEGKYTGSTGVIFVGQFNEGNAVDSMNNAKLETSVSSPLPLYIRDVLGAAESNVVESIAGVQSVISRNNGTLKKVFQYYSALDQGVEVLTTPSTWRKDKFQGSLSLLQFYRLCNDAKLLSKETSIAAVDRMLLNFIDRHTTTNVGTYTSGEENSLPPAPGFPGAEPDPSSPNSENGVISVTVPAADGMSLDGSAARPARGSDDRGGRSTKHRGSEKHRSSSTRSNMEKGPYHSPWDKYKRELHTFQGELNFREYVEMLVRIAAAQYNTAVFGPLANKLELVINEHLLPYTCNPALGQPLFPITRSHRTTVQPYTGLLFRFFLAYSQASSIGCSAANIPSAGGTSSGSGSPSSTSAKQMADSLGAANKTLPLMTMRQFCVMLKECDILGETRVPGSEASHFTMSSVMKLFPYDPHPKLTTMVNRKQNIANGHALQYGKDSGPNAAMMGTISGSSTGHGSPGGTGGPQHLERPAATPNNQNHASVNDSPRHSIGGSTMSLEPVDQAALHFVPGEEVIFRRKVDGTIRSRGYQNNNLHSTLLMELELTYIEFVERLLAVACSKYPTSMSTSQRLAALIDTHLVPNGGKVGWFKSLHGQHLASAPTSARGASNEVGELVKQQSTGSSGM